MATSALPGLEDRRSKRLVWCSPPRGCAWCHQWRAFVGPSPAAPGYQAEPNGFWRCGLSSPRRRSASASSCLPATPRRPWYLRPAAFGRRAGLRTPHAPLSLRARSLRSACDRLRPSYLGGLGHSQLVLPCEVASGDPYPKIGGRAYGVMFTNVY